MLADVHTEEYLSQMRSSSSKMAQVPGIIVIILLLTYVSAWLSSTRTNWADRS